MPNGKNSRRWTVNVISFVLLSILVVSGLINWLVLPRGHGGEGGVFISLRHFLVTIHGWTAILFLIAIAVHLLLHKTYIKANLRGREKSDKNQTG
jgi:hypothetical protein